MNSPYPFFSELTDPRVEHTKAHMLEDILIIAIASVARDFRCLLIGESEAVQQVCNTLGSIQRRM